MESNPSVWFEINVQNWTCAKAVIVSVLATNLLVTACSKAPQSSSEPATLSYHCESGEMISATYDSTDTATVQYKGQNHEMQIAVSGSGSRYVDDGLEWWTKGSGAGAAGTLFRHQEDGTSGESLEICIEQ